MKIKLLRLGALVALLAGSAPAQTTVTLSPVSDAYVNDSAPDTVFNSAWLVVGHSPAEFTPLYRSFLRFNLSGIPTDATVYSAVLHLRLQSLEGGTTAAIELRRVLASWSSASLTWNNQPGVTAPVTTTTVGSTIGADYFWSITSLVQNWVSGQYVNDGLSLRIANETTATATRTFASANHATVSIRPQLVVTYAVPPDITVAPTSLAFGNQPVGSSSDAQTVTVQNNGGSALTVSSLASSSAEFVVTFTGGLPATVVTNASLTFQVRFAPTSPGLKNATVTITSNDPDEPTRTVSCSGTGAAPDIDVTPASLAFGNQLLNSLSSPQTVTVSNSGNATLTVSAVTTSSGAEFPLSNLPSLPANLAPGASLSFQAQFKPASVGSRNGTIAITSNDPDEASVQVGCSGTGTAPDIAVAPASLSFGNQLLNTTSAPQSMTVSNAGSALLTVTAISSGSAEFPLSGLPSLPANLSPGAAFSFQVRFTPANLGARGAPVAISSSDPDEPSVSVACTGMGVVPDIDLVPTALNFSNQLLGSQSVTQHVTIQNTGSANLHISSISSSSSAILLSLNTSLPAILPSGGALSFGVRFAPTSAGLTTGSVTVSSDDPDETTRTVTCAGLGLPELPRSTFYDGSAGAWTRFTGLLGPGTNVAMTVEAWVRREDPARTEAILSQNRATSFWFGFTGPRLRFYRSGGQYADSTGTVAGQRWTHVAAAYDGSRVEFFIDGRPAGANLLGHSGASQADTVQLAGDEQGANLRGFLDEVRLWDHSRSERQIRDAMFDAAGPEDGLLALFPSGGPWEAISGLPGQAGPGAVGRNVGGLLREPLQIPRAFWPMTVDGQVDPENEYLGAAEIMIHYDEGPDAIAYLVHEGEAGNGNLYVAITGLRLPAGRDPALSWVAVGLDPRGSQSELASPFHLQLRGFLDGAPPLLFRGDGLGGFDYFDDVPGPDALWDVKYDSIEFHLPDVEFRVAKSQDWLWRDTNGLMIGHFDVAAVSDNYLAPNGTVRNSPATWPVATYVENSAVTPRAVFSGQVFNYYRANPIRNHPVRVIQDSDGFELARVLTDNDGAFLISTWVPANQPLRLEVGECPDGLYLRSDVSQHDIQPLASSARWVVFPAAEPGINAYAPVDFYLRQPIGPISLTDYRPRGAPAEKLVPQDPAARVKIFGANLHNQIQVYLYGCLDLDRQNGPSVPLGCIEGEDYFEARVVARAVDESWVEVEVPPVPLAARNPSGWWGWAVRDNWDRPERAGAVWTRVGGAPDNHFELRVARVGGARPLLVILVQYLDQTFADPNFQANYAARIFGPAEPNVSAYYRENSQGLFTFLPAAAGDQDGTADGLVTVLMSVSVSNTASGSEYRRQALALADPVFDFSRYDADGNGRIEDRELGVLIIQANGGPSGKTATADAVSADGVELGGLAVAAMSENAPNYVLYHELAHIIEYHGVTGPDLYNTRDGFVQKAIVWSLDDQGAIARRGDVAGEIALELDADSVGEGGAVAAYRDQNGQLSLAAYDLSNADNPRTKGLARAGLASDLSLCPVSPTRVLTALQSGGGNLKLIVWDVDADLEFTRRGDYTPEPATDIDVTAVSSTRGVAAFRNAEGHLQLMVFDLSAEGELELRANSTAGEATEINLASLGENRVITAVRVPDSGDLKLICFDVAADGSLTRRGDYQAGSAQDIDLATVGPQRVAASVRTASNWCKVLLFEVDAAGEFARLGSYEDEDGEMVEETRGSIPGEIPPSQPMTSIGVAGARIVFGYIRTNHLMRVRTLDIQGDGRLSLAGSGESGGSVRSFKIVRLNASRFATVSRSDGTIWTGGKFGLLGDNTGRELVHLDPCTKLKLGWLSYGSALQSGTYALSPMGIEGAEALIVRNPCHRETEYFIVEVRTGESLYESALPDQGLAIWHVDETKAYPEPFVTLEWLRGSAETALWAATDTALTIYDDSSSPAGSRWSDFTPSGIAIRGVTAVGNGLSFEVTVSPCLEGLAILRAGGGAMLMEFLGNPGRVYRIEYSSDLKSWATLATITVDARGQGRYHDSSAVFAPVRFYRLVAP